MPTAILRCPLGRTAEKTAVSKCDQAQNTVEAYACEVRTVVDGTCADATPSTDGKAPRSATVGICNVESPVCDRAGPVCVTKNLVNQIDDQDRLGETT
ncbi:hypothetical protein PF005_g31547 [Phytophthora fragariae]|nr:hypothetical protein PF003_g13222 [Phytophthora fragariae]KAE8959138.1 hypothetical protein PF011_g30527 [Phytophthora fragariae]KAE9061642.1 hypothetical protein PF010_g29742 [Phytophthora fragariae]KAE9160673.1 hypothetical protein PF005_g31547 [Phytophthora fragariae]KAE9164089.1 hypothetical protein PF002_g31687 [Phytophthora fragariae]